MIAQLQQRVNSEEERINEKLNEKMKEAEERIQNLFAEAGQAKQALGMLSICCSLVLCCVVCLLLVERTRAELHKQAARAAQQQVSEHSFLGCCCVSLIL